MRSTLPAIGHSRLDDDHSEFLELARRLRRASGEGILPAFDALRAHANEHFEFEDAMIKFIFYRQTGGAPVLLHR